MGQIRSVKDVIDRIAKLIVILSSTLMIVLTLVVFFIVIARYFFNVPLSFTYALIELLFCWIVFLQVINVTLDNENIDIEFFVKLTPKPVQVVAAYATKLIMLFFSMYITYSSYKLASAVGN